MSEQMTPASYSMVVVGGKQDKGFPTLPLSWSLSSTYMIIGGFGGEQLQKALKVWFWFNLYKHSTLCGFKNNFKKLYPTGSGLKLWFWLVVANATALRGEREGENSVSAGLISTQIIL